MRHDAIQNRLAEHRKRQAELLAPSSTLSRSSFAQRFCHVAVHSSDRMGRLMGERMPADTEYLAGNLEPAWRLIEHVLDKASRDVDRYVLANRIKASLLRALAKCRPRRASPRSRPAGWAS